MLESRESISNSYAVYMNALDVLKNNNYLQLWYTGTNNLKDIVYQDICIPSMVKIIYEKFSINACRLSNEF